MEAPKGLTKELDEEPEDEEPEDEEPEDEEPEDEEPEDEESGDEEPEDKEPPVPEPVVEAKKGLTKADKVIYKALQSKKDTHTEEERKQYKALKAKAKA